MPSKITYLLLFTFCFSFCVCKRYDNYTLYRGIPIEVAQLDYLRSLTKNNDINFWREPGILHKPVELVVGPKDKLNFMEEAKRLGLYLSTMIEDVQEAFDRQTVKTYIRRKMESFDWDNYFRLDDIYDYLGDLAAANRVEMIFQSIGKSHQKRDIMGVRVALKGANLRSTVIMEGGIHAREWISPAFVTFFIYELMMSRYSNNALLKEVALSYEWFFVPVLNPDGYEYTHTNDRLWRKNRDPDGEVDLNRNFDNKFGTVGVSKVKYADTYCGKSAFSEHESRAMRDFVDRHSKNLKYYLSIHSYGQCMIIPFADSKKHMLNFDEVSKKCNEAGDRIAMRYRTQYKVGTAYDTVGYLTSGVSACWVKKTYNTPYVVTFELRDTGFYGFALPPEKIVPTCEETLDGLLHLLAPTGSNHTIQPLRVPYYSTGHDFILDKIVMVFNFFLFIIVRSG